MQCNGLGHAYAYHQCVQAWNGQGQYASNWHGTTPNGPGAETTFDNIPTAPDGPGAESSCLTLSCITGGLDFIGNVSISGIPSITPQTSYYIGGNVFTNIPSLNINVPPISIGSIETPYGRITGSYSFGFSLDNSSTDITVSSEGFTFGNTDINRDNSFGVHRTFDGSYGSYRLERGLNQRNMRIIFVSMIM